MNRCWWIAVGLLFACATEGPGELALQEAPLLGDPHKHKAWKAWRGHHHKHWHRCRPSEPGAASCAWSNYSEGLSGADATLVFFDTRERGVAYAVSGGEIYQSTDSGETWSPRGDTDASVRQLAADGADPASLIASTGAGVKVSSNYGANWTTVGLSGLQLELLQSPVVQPQRMYVSIDMGPILSTTDAGDHWSMAGVNYPRGDTFGLSVDPRNALDLVSALQFFPPERAGTNGRGAIFRSLDGGVTWQNVYEIEAKMYGLVRCPANPDVLLAATQDGIARSLDNGTTWSLSPIPTMTEGSMGVAVNPHDCDDYYALQANEGPRHTRDGGATFSEPLIEGLQVMATGSFPGSLAIDPEDPTHLILSTHGGFFASHDSGEHWSALPVMVLMNISALAVSASRPTELWLGSWGQGVWTRSSEDAQWERIGIERLPRDYVGSLGLDPASHRVIIGSSPPLFSPDGERFAETMTNSMATSAVFHPTDPDVIYMTTQIQGVLRSADNGQSWQEVNGNLPRWSTTASTGVDARRIVINPARTEQLFITTNEHGIYRSDDAAASWTQLLASSEAASCLVLVPQPTAAAPHLYACVSGISMSEDGGATWTQRNEGLPSLGIAHLVHDPDTGRLYASSGRGIFVLVPGAEEWRAFDPDCEARVGAMVLMKENGRSYLIVGAEHGVRRLEL